MTRDPDAAPRAWDSFRLLERSAASQPVVGWYGGHPRGVRSHLWPRCAVCGAAMCHMGQFQAGPWLDLGGRARMSLFICHATGGRCEDWDPHKGANRVVLHDQLDDELYDGPPTVRVYRRCELTVGEPTDELAWMLEVKEKGTPMRQALRALRHDKLGGGAVWLAGDATPRARSGAPMRLVAQLTTELVPFDITSRGMAWVFLDPEEPGPNAACLLWQSG